MRRSRVWQGLGTDVVAGSEVGHRQPQEELAAGAVHPEAWSARPGKAPADRPRPALHSGLARSIGSAEPPQAGRLQGLNCARAPSRSTPVSRRRARPATSPGPATQDTRPLGCGGLARTPMSTPAPLPGPSRLDVFPPLKPRDPQGRLDPESEESAFLIGLEYKRRRALPETRSLIGF